MRALSTLLALMLLGTLEASAQDADASTESEAPLSIDAVAERPIPAGSTLDPTAAATTLTTRDRPRALESLDELLLEAPGAVTRRTGGQGSFTGLALRGAGAEHTTVFLGSVPLTSPDGSAFDLSTLPAWALDGVEVYRGGAPTWLGSGGIGGVLHLVPRSADGTGFELAGGVGSFGLYEGRASASVRQRELSVLAAAGATHFTGRYPYRDDARTALDPSDDTDRLRLGAENTDANFALHLATRIERIHVEVAGVGLERVGGLGALPARRSDDPTGQRNRSRYVAGLTLGWLDDDRSWAHADESAVRIELTGALSLERRLVRDPFAQFGLLPRDTDDLLLRGYGRFAIRGRIVPAFTLSAVASYARDSVALSDRLAPAVPTAARDVGTVAAEAQLDLRVEDVRIEARASGRIELASAATIDAARERPLAVLPTARLGVAVAPVPWLAIQGSFATAGRLPTLLELFGDRAFLVGNPMLRPEQSWGGDLGVVASGSISGVLRGEAELRGFGMHIDDLVVYRRSEASQLVPENRASALSFGLEGRVAGTLFDLVEGMGSITVLDARDPTSGRLLPLRPSVSGMGRLGLRIETESVLRRLRIFVDVEYVSGTFADPANLITLPERARVGIGLTADLVEHVEVALTLRDVFDARGLDLLGAPLPGRSVALSLTVH